ncbi:hypothetical protein D3227_37840 [Mesorhizobium waimense]|uniref:Uncharacterized protein n=1 Tax=Mesorhizobium waimense TaxID=1300307 RepID=A0A3A5K5I6_9HYPH|nr:hypothetical protein D3227_37840 [Mesorhizobium waimense]
MSSTIHAASLKLDRERAAHSRRHVRDCENRVNVSHAVIGSLRAAIPTAETAMPDFQNGL